MRKSAAQAFYLAVFALFSGEECRVRAATPSSAQHASPDVCAVSTTSSSIPSGRTAKRQTTYPKIYQFEPTAKVSDACASYADLDALNDKLHPYVRNLANNTDFFSYYRLNLYNQKCPFWSDENGLCGNIACAVTTLENEEDVPKIWRAEELSKLEGPKARHPGKGAQRRESRPLQGMLGEGVGESCVVEYDDECDERDYCVPDDEGASAKGDYVSLSENPERFTGYAGEGAHQVWEAIYRENCFSRPSTVSEQSAAVPGLSAPFPGFSQNQAQAASDFKQVMKAHDREEARKSGAIEDGLEFEDECLEKRVFYRVISGMHASISTHLCHDYLNQTTGTWGPNLQCYKDRLHAHPERISNLYFNYALVLRAVGKLRDYVQDYTFCTGDPQQDADTKRQISVLSSAIPAGPRIFDESVMFVDQTASGISLKEDFRNRFRNVSRIMDCVGCDKCRLWGKLQTNGFGTALKVLFEFDPDAPGEEKVVLRRTEMVALVNLLDKISAALKAVEDFRGMLAAELEGKDPEASAAASREAKESRYEDFKDLDDLEDFDGFPDSDDAEGSKKKEKDMTIAEEFYAEFDLVWHAFTYVLRSWMELPRLLPQIVLTESGRLWDAFLGKPVRPRMWHFRPLDREAMMRWRGRDEV